MLTLMNWGGHMKTLKGYIFRLYPNVEQKTLINRTIGSARPIYNIFLRDRIDTYNNTKKGKSAYDQNIMIPSLLVKYTFLKEVDSGFLRNASNDLECAYDHFFKQGGFPKFKAKGVKDSYKTNNTVNTYKGKTYHSIELDLEKRLIKLPKLKWVKIKGYRNKESINGRIKSVVIRKDAGRYYVSVSVEEEVYKPMFTPQSIVGIDLGIKDLIVTSHNEKIKNIIKDRSKRLKGLQKALARCKAGSKNRYKIKLKIQRLWQKIRNARKYLIHDITNKLIKENDIIACEDLDIKSMYKDHNIAKSLNSNPIGEIIRVLKYKADWNNKKLIQIDRYYPSSQECSVCGFQNKELKNLSIRKYECPMCHTEHDRDFNASVNIMFEGLKIYMKGIGQA